MRQINVFVGAPLPPEAVACLFQNGFLSAVPPTPPASTDSDFTPLTPSQGEIYAALAHKPLNANQIELLAIYLRAHINQEGALSVEEAGRRLAAALGLDSARAPDYVRGALRSFGRRLLQHLSRSPMRVGRDRLGEGVADEVPLLALLAIETGPSGQVRHRLTADGASAVAAALGTTRQGWAAGGVQSGRPEVDNPEAIVLLGMTRLAASLLLRVQQSLGISLDETVKVLTARAGAG